MEKEFIIKEELCYLIVVRNDLRLKMWNKNKYYAWLSNGEIISNSDDVLFEWEDKSFSSKHMYQIIKILDLNKEENSCTVDRIIKRLKSEL